MKVTFFGTGGSIPALYNTTSMEVVASNGDEYIFDGGSGIRELGNQLFGRGFAPGQKGKAKIFLSHFHYDHLQGLPFFGPGYVAGNEIEIFGYTRNEKSLEELLTRHMETPFFPVPLPLQKGFTAFNDITPGDHFENGVQISSIDGNHAGGSLVYAIHEGDSKVVFGTDYEIDGFVMGEEFGPKDRALIDFARDADVLVWDSQYTPEEYIPAQNGKAKSFGNYLQTQHKNPDGEKFSSLSYGDRVSELMRLVPKSKIGWGHSTYEKGVDVALEANVGTLVLTHHDPNRTKDDLGDIGDKAKQYLMQKEIGSQLKIVVAHDGYTMDL